MALKTFVKISHVNNLSDARYCAGMEVNILGFELEPDGEHYVDPTTFDEITSWLSGVAYAGEFSQADAAFITTQLNHYKLDYIQIENPDLIHEISGLAPSLIFKMPLSGAQETVKALEKYREEITFLLLDGEEDHLAPSFFPVIKEIATSWPVLLGTGIQPDAIEALLSNLAIKGIALQGGNEIKPGYKDFDALADILEVLEVDDYA